MVTEIELFECTNMCLIVNGYWDRAVWMYKYKSSMNGDMEKKNYLLLILFQF